MEEMKLAVETALEQLAELTRAGAAPAQIIETIGQIVAGWADEAETDAAAAQARIEAMWDSVSRDAAELQQQLGDADGADPQALAAAKRTLKAMQAAVTALAATHERL